MEVTVITIHSDDDLHSASALLDELFDATPRESERIQLQAKLIEEYESRRFPRGPVTQADIIHFLMESNDMFAAEMGAILGTRSRVSETLHGKIDLSMSMIRRLCDRFRLPADVFIKETARRQTVASKKDAGPAMV